MTARAAAGRRAIWSWAAYDCANSAFALTVMTSFVPLQLAGYWSDGAPAAVGTFRLGMANGLASLLVALSVPVLGTLADSGGRRRAWLMVATLAGVLLTAGLALAGQGDWQLALVLYVAASIAFAVANSLYDALLVAVAPPGQLDRVSALGYGVGYLGSALLFALNALMLAQPDRFGFESRAAAVQGAFLLVAAWWLLFSLPLRWVTEPPAAPARSVAGNLRELAATLRRVRSEPVLWRFLVAYWLYIDGVYTIIKMAVDFGLALGLGAEDLVLAILVTNVIAFPAALAFGRLADRVGPRPGILLGLAVYGAAALAAPFITSSTGFYALAIAVGLVQGGVQSLSRSLFARLVPAAQAGEYFGLYNMLGKFAAILGPVLTGVVALATGEPRYGILALILLFTAGGLLLMRVRVPPAGSP